MTRATQRLAALAMVPVLVLTVGCGKASEKIAEKAIERQTGAEVDIDGDGGVSFQTEDGSYTADGDGNVVVETEDGTITAGLGLPKGWPEDLPVPEGVTIAYGSVTPDAASASGTSDRSPAELMEDVRAAFSDWEVEDEMSANAGTELMQVTLVNGERTLTVQAVAGEPTTFSMYHEGGTEGG